MNHKQRELVERWADALESGKYNPCKHELRTHMMVGDSPEPVVCHCALGVLLEMEAPHKWIGPSSHLSHSHGQVFLGELDPDVTRAIVRINDASPILEAHKEAAHHLRHLLRMENEG